VLEEGGRVVQVAGIGLQAIFTLVVFNRPVHSDRLRIDQHAFQKSETEMT
jgi:hypothetical protein